MKTSSKSVLVRNEFLWSGWHRTNGRSHWKLTAQHVSRDLCWQALRDAVQGGDFLCIEPYGPNPNAAKSAARRA